MIYNRILNRSLVSCLNEVVKNRFVEDNNIAAVYSLLDSALAVTLKGHRICFVRGAKGTNPPHSKGC